MASASTNANDRDISITLELLVAWTDDQLTNPNKEDTDLFLRVEDAVFTRGFPVTDVLTLTVVEDHDSTAIDQYGAEHYYHGYDGGHRYWFKHGMPYLDFIVAANRGGYVVDVPIERHGYMMCSIRRDDGTRFVRNDKSFRSRITMDALVEVHPGDFILYLDYHGRTFWSPCGRRNEVVGGLRRLLVTSRTSSWVVPPPKVVFYRDG